MATRTGYTDGQFCWVDLMARDLAGASSFYCDLFGWTATAQDTEGGPPYTIFRLGDKRIAGLGEMNDEMKSSGMPPIWNSYISVDDINATTKRVAELGGGVMMEPFQIMQAGKMGIVADATGAVFSLWQPIEHIGAELVNDPGSWVWNELITDNVDAATKFYGNLFGWSAVAEEGAAIPYWTLERDNRRLGGMMPKMPEMGDIPSCWTVYFAVDDIHAATERVTQLGGNICQPPFEVSVGHISVVSDPQGAVFDLIQMTVPADD